ncbi:MAG: energy transducer TonB [Flavobacterium sp.]|nr:MAG: energy transducer TonB [Flavobacterium sp.]
MNHVSIFERKWLDVVFDGKNKNYGAYQLRLQNPRTTIAALFYGFLFLSGAAGILALSSFAGKPLEVKPIADDNDIHVTTVELVQPKQPEKAAAPAAPNEKPKQNLPPVVAPTPQADPEPKPDENPGTANSGTPGTGTTPTPGTSVIATTPASEPENTGTEALPTRLLDKLPEFPGGMNRFYAYVGKNFARPEIEDMKSARVVVSFVIEKDGSLTDIKVGRDPGYGMGKEAIRVLKALKEKWEPGMVKGKPVRTLYSLPITVNME